MLPPTIIGSQVTLHVRSTWGDVNFVGLSGLSLIGADLEPLKLEWGRDCTLVAFPEDINCVPGVLRVLLKLPPSPLFMVNDHSLP